jgi:hypothetical protein
MCVLKPYLPAVFRKAIASTASLLRYLVDWTSIVATRGFRQVSKSYNDNVGKLADGKKDPATTAKNLDQIKHSNVFVCENFRKDNFSLLWKMQSVTAEKEKQAPDAAAQPESQATAGAVQSASPNGQKEPGKREAPIELDRDSERDNRDDGKPARKRHRGHTQPGSEMKKSNAHFEVRSPIRAESQSSSSGSQELNLVNSRRGIASPRTDSARAGGNVAQLQPGIRGMVRPPDLVVGAGCTPSSANSSYIGREARLQAMNANAISEANLAASVSNLLNGSALSYSTPGAVPNLPNLSLLSQTDHQHQLLRAQQIAQSDHQHQLLRAQQIAQTDQLLRAQQMLQPQMQASLPLSLISQYPVGLQGHFSLANPSALSTIPNSGVIDSFIRDMSIRHPSSYQILPAAALYQQPAQLLPSPAPAPSSASQQAQIELLHQNNALLQRLLSRIQETPQNQGESQGRETG